MQVSQNTKPAAHHANRLLLVPVPSFEDVNGSFLDNMVTKSVDRALPPKYQIIWGEGKKRRVSIADDVRFDSFDSTKKGDVERRPSVDNGRHQNMKIHHGHQLGRHVLIIK
jgi:hypothetical protein